ncbi:type II secretion system protein [Rathayibacter sp. YIM 133350]|uniref:type IV pilus modification PilV family protein n=1 Tax=Rathayibacter sp. YIM 133350 TaxID=3131992 RepID=UPI00307D871B
MRSFLEPNERSGDAGIGIVEILVALMVFAVLAVGIAYSLTYTMRMTRDNQARQVAVNLASSDIDSVRADGDPFDIFSDSYDVAIPSGDTYKVTRVTSWVTPTGSDATCGTSGGALQYKHVSVSVTWTGMLSSTNPVTSDTLIAPSRRINDPSKGTLLISVKDASGGGAQGVTFVSTPAQATTPTDEDGCSFLLQVAPGTYTIKLNTAGYIDYAQNASPSITRTVAAGSSASFSFQYDQAATYTLAYASNSPGPAAKLPTNLDTTFINTYGLWPMTAVSNPAKLHPYPVGYQAVAGKYVPQTPTVAGCESPDPEAWDPVGPASAPTLVGTRVQAQTAAPGGSANLSVPMGIVNVAGGPVAKLVAVSEPDTPLTGQPTCADVGTAPATPAMTYQFGAVIPATGSVKIALPYGSWRLFSNSGTDASPVLLPIPAPRVSRVTSGFGPDITGLIALDPRAAP